MHDPVSLPACLFSGEQPNDELITPKPNQSVVISVYRTKISGHCRLITITWYRDLLAQGFSVSIDTNYTISGSTENTGKNSTGCKVEMRPWNFWRKHGSKRVILEEKPLHVYWDLRSARFSGDPEPRSNYYVTVVSEEDEEAMLILGDLKKEALKRSGSRPAAIEAALVSRREHVFGKKRFVIRSKLHERGRYHEIAIECSSSSSGSSVGGNIDPEMEIRIDGQVAIGVKHLQWKFRGNQSITVGKARVEVYWDVHDWLFSPGLSHALFIFKPVLLFSSSTSSSSSSSLSLANLFSSNIDGDSVNAGASPGFCLYLHAWKLE